MNFPHSERFNLLAIQQDDSFEFLDQTLQAFVNNLAKGYSQLSDLTSQESVTTRSTIAQEHNTTRDHINSNFEDMQLRSFTEQQCKKLLGSLYYSEIHERQEQISAAHEETFEFIFDRTGQSVRPWGNFVEWLEQGAGVYWINGKAGSGKSTLINYIATNSRSMDSLRVWSQSSQVLTVTYFFWNAGTKLQKSSLGLLRSLLYQLLGGHQEVIPELAKFQDIPTFDAPMPVWTKKRLESSLEFVMDKNPQPLCLFIDGLDESDDGEEDLLKLISALQSRPLVKICLSSRPLQSYINAFEYSAQLKLQDLTRQAIERYVDDRLHLDTRMGQLLRKEPLCGRSLIGDVLEKADGVFLWVELAVKLLLTGLTNGDDLDMLKYRLYLLPKGIESLYMHMWSRIAEDQKLYRDEAARYFRIALKEEMSLLQFLVATNNDLQLALLDPRSTPPSIGEIVSMCKNVEVRILACCAGLLEVDHFERRETNKYEKKEDEVDEADNDQDQDNLNRREDDPRLIHLHKRTRVRFIHRTAFDFLLSTRQGHMEFLFKNAPRAHAGNALIKSEIGIERLLPQTSPANLSKVFNELRKSQIAANDALESLMDTVESYVSAKHSSGVSQGPKWLRNYYETFAEPKRHADTGTEFLGLAAAFGICLDMSERLLQHPRRTDPIFTNYLICSAVFWSSDFTGLRMQLMLVLLSDGADPNTTFQPFQPWANGMPTSCWYNFLYQIYAYQSRGYPLFELCKAFLDNGADIHEKIQIGYWSLWAGDCIKAWQRGQLCRELVCEVSTRYILTELLGHHFQFSEIEKRFESAGAEPSRRVLLARHNGSDSSKAISEQDSQYLLAAIDKQESEASASTAMELWDRIGEVSTRGPGDECPCHRCSDRGFTDKFPGT
jgi:hypothetical protein